MRQRWENTAHLIRPALVFAGGVVLFLAARQLLVPPSFGQLGHYRAAVLQEMRAKPPVFAGQAACAGCHSEEAETRNKGSHARVSCEACHGPGAAHAADPLSVRAGRPEASPLCIRCHEADPAKPKWFKQVPTKEHSGGAACGSCHSPHSPKL